MSAGNNLVGIGILPTFASNNNQTPKAYLIAQFYNENNQPTHQKILYLTQNNQSWNALGEIQEIALENGRVEIFVANESNTKVYFDNLSIYKSPTPIVQENHYYPFGMNLVGIEKEGTPNHRFQFMGKEKESSFGLNWTETDWRGYDGQVGRFWQVDKLAEQAPDWTAYRYGFNNPLRNTDPSGLWEETKDGTKTTNKDEIASFLKTGKVQNGGDKENKKENGNRRYGMTINVEEEQNGLINKAMYGDYKQIATFDVTFHVELIETTNEQGNKVKREKFTSATITANGFNSEGDREAFPYNIDLPQQIIGGDIIFSVMITPTEGKSATSKGSDKRKSITDAGGVSGYYEKTIGHETGTNESSGNERALNKFASSVSFQIHPHNPGGNYYVKNESWLFFRHESPQSQHIKIDGRVLRINSSLVTKR